VLSSCQMGNKIDARKMNGVTQAHLRRLVVLAVRGGMSQTQASQVFGVSVRAANKWVAIDRAGGLRALRLKRRGRRAGQGRLNQEQTSRIEELIIHAPPDQLKLPFDLWTRAAVVNLIEQEYGIAVSLTTASRYLKGWGMSLQGPVKAAGERDNSTITRWLRHEYRVILREARRDNAVIYWGNEMGLRRDHVAGVSHSHAGQSSNGRVTGSRVSCHMISAMTNRGHLAFIVHHGRSDGAQIAEFMQRLLKQAGTKVYLIVEGHPVHRSSSVKRFVSANAAQIRLIDRLSHDRERSAGELRSRVVKANAVGGGRMLGRGAMATAVRRHLPHRQRQPREKYVRYPA
jgi:transposase